MLLKLLFTNGPLLSIGGLPFLGLADNFFQRIMRFKQFFSLHFLMKTFLELNLDQTGMCHRRLKFITLFGENPKRIPCSGVTALFNVLYCIVLYCIALHCIALHCIALHCIALHCIALHCIALYCIVLYCIVLYCIREEVHV